MRITKVGENDGFSPLHLNVTVESPEELEKLHALFNWIPMVQFLNICGEPVRAILETHYKQETRNDLYNTNTKQLNKLKQLITPHL